MYHHIPPTKHHTYIIPSRTISSILDHLISFTLVHTTKRTLDDTECQIYTNCSWQGSIHPFLVLSPRDGSYLPNPTSLDRLMATRVLHESAICFGVESCVIPHPQQGLPSVDESTRLLLLHGMNQSSMACSAAAADISEADWIFPACSSLIRITPFAARDWKDISLTLILFTVPLWLTKTTCSSL